MKRLTAKLIDVSRTAGNEISADDPDQLLRKLQSLVLDEYHDELQTTRNLLIHISDIRNPVSNPLQGLFVEANNAQELLDELDKVIRETYRAELRSDADGAP
jgi:hypothetical protein